MSSHKEAQETQEKEPGPGTNKLNPEGSLVPLVPFCGYSFRAECVLLLSCARTNAPPDVVKRIRSLVSETPIDWNYFFLLARRHAVVPLIYRQLKDLVPPEHLQLFKKHYQENAARNVVLTAELCRLIKLFAAAGIDAIPYKGPILSLFAYDDLALRRFVDLDVIVKKQDVVRARDLLLADNYVLFKPLTNEQQELLLRTQHNLQFTKDNRRLIVELHWEVAPHLFASTVQGDTLWQDLVAFDLNGTTLKTLSADDLLFSLCVHGSRHLWERLGWICDVAELISRRKLNWSTLLDRAAKADSERMFLLGLHLAHKLLQAPLPTEVQQRCAADKRLAPLAANIVDHLFNGPEHVPATSGEIFKYNLGVRKSLSA
ncbi:MAG TPA: nucleotidyltransferase family protein, partial [Pyrinomonadaceae bacterium]|nr:nucleotidyltransferase family protein [Pyrinomonadaceae bacterium]